jgi:oxygen-dependent protoporphyrinogen oxidase
MTRRVVVVGGGIAGLTVAERLGATLGADDVSVELREAGDRLGGALKTSSFAGRATIDEGADAFLARVPHGTALAERVGLAGELTSPSTSAAFVWHNGLHRIPDGLLLGVPANPAALAASQLLSPRGKARAAIEPLLPNRNDPGDSIGRLIRARFGDEVHERLVDALVGSIYATDTDRFSLAMVPQLAALADGRRSLLLAARRARRNAPNSSGPLFRTPQHGMEMLATAVAAAAERAGVTVTRSRAVASVGRDRPAWRIDDELADVVVLATPADVTARLVSAATPSLADQLAPAERAGVTIVTMALPALPPSVAGTSGYLVPKPDQRLVTAASFGSQKWSHWAGAGEIVRVSLGRDGLPVDDLDDDTLVAAAVDEVGRHLGADLQPTEVRVSRWPRSFPQYRPGHLRWLDAVDRATPPGLFLTGASYRGIGVPACIADAERTATDVVTYLASRPPLSSPNWSPRDRNGAQSSASQE